MHIRDVLETIAVKHPELISKFGGHAMAAGLSLSAERYQQFATLFAEEVEKHFSEADLKATILSDGELMADQISLDNANLLQRAMPWGQQLPEPMFDGRFSIVSQRLVGQRHLKLVVSSGKNQVFDAIAFNIDTELWPNLAVDAVRLVYRLDVNRYRGRETIQLVVNHLERAE